MLHACAPNTGLLDAACGDAMSTVGHDEWHELR